MTPTPDPLGSHPLSRRSILLGGATLAVLGACGSGDDGTAGETGTGPGDEPSGEGSPSTEGGRAGFGLIPFFDARVLAVGGQVRAPYGLADIEGVLRDSDSVPEELTFEIRLEGEPVGDPVTVARRGLELPRPYFPLTFTPERAGIYDVLTDVEGEPVPAALQIPEEPIVALPAPGEPLTPFETPTVEDPRGVDPICTQEPGPCALHDQTLTAALAADGPTAFLIATPAYCRTAVCGPVLDVLLDRRDRFGAVTMVHAEVYEDGEAAAADINQAALAPVVEAYGLSFEPSLILAHADGTVAERLDFVYDASELTEALQRLTA